VSEHCAGPSAARTEVTPSRAAPMNGSLLIMMYKAVVRSPEIYLFVVKIESGREQGVRELKVSTKSTTREEAQLLRRK
jgi:hypothetical protein